MRKFNAPPSIEHTVQVVMAMKHRMNNSAPAAEEMKSEFENAPATESFASKSRGLRQKLQATIASPETILKITHDGLNYESINCPTSTSQKCPVPIFQPNLVVASLPSHRKMQIGTKILPYVELFKILGLSEILSPL